MNELKTSIASFDPCSRVLNDDPVNGNYIEAHLDENILKQTLCYPLGISVLLASFINTCIAKSVVMQATLTRFLSFTPGTDNISKRFYNPSNFVILIVNQKVKK
jgi:hypothetical protein